MVKWTMILATSYIRARKQITQLCISSRGISKPAGGPAALFASIPLSHFSGNKTTVLEDSTIYLLQQLVNRLSREKWINNKQINKVVELLTRKKKTGEGFRKAREIVAVWARLGTKVRSKHGDQDASWTRRCIVWPSKTTRKSWQVLKLNERKQKGLLFRWSKASCSAVTLILRNIDLI